MKLFYKSWIKHFFGVLVPGFAILMLLGYRSCSAEAAGAFALLLLSMGLVLCVAAGVAWWFTRHLRVVSADVEGRNSLLQALEQVPIGALLNDRQGKRVYVNACWQQLTGLSAADADGEGWRKAIHPDDLEKVLASWELVFNEQQVVELEWRFLRPDSEVRWVRGALLPLRNEVGVVGAYIGVMADITPIREQEAMILAGSKSLERAHAELDSVLNSSSDPIVGIDMDFCFTIFNTAYASMFDRLYSLKVERGFSLLDGLSSFAEDRARQMTLWGRAMQGERFLVRQVYGDVDRERRTFDLSLSPQLDRRGELHGAVMIMRDVTVAARVEEALMRSEELFRTATESSLDAIMVLAPVKDEAWRVMDFRVMECNQVALDLFGRRRAESVGRLLSEVMPSLVDEGLLSRMSAVLESGRSHEEERQAGDARTMPLWQQLQIVAISDGLTLMIRDITQRKLFELGLQANEARTSAILANVQEGVITVGADGRIRLVNPACGRIFDYSPADILNKSISFLFPQLAASLEKLGLESALQVELGVEPAVSNAVSGVRRDGSRTMIEMSFKPVVLDDEHFYTVTLHDMTERNAYELRLQQKIEELETLQDSLNLSNDQLSMANRELSRLAHLDGLTGLANRRHFDKTLHVEWMRAMRDQLPLAVIMLDVDHFKRYNDGYGHQAGDECLKLVAEAIQRALRRPADFAARYGGEEFVVVLPNTDSDGARLVACAVLDDVRRLSIPHANSPTAAYVTISAGVASVKAQADMDEHSLVASADQALYLSKQSGRNRVTVAGA